LNIQDWNKPKAYWPVFGVVTFLVILTLVAGAMDIGLPAWGYLLFAVCYLVIVIYGIALLVDGIKGWLKG